jgi:hypothetical protein
MQVAPILADFSTDQTAVEITSSFTEYNTDRQLTTPTLKLWITNLQLTAEAPDGDGSTIRIEYRDNDGTSNAVVIFRTAATSVNAGGVTRNYDTGLFVPKGKRVFLVVPSAVATGLIIHGDIEYRCN